MTEYLPNSKPPVENQDLTSIRRKSAAVSDDAWIKALLQRGAYGVMATSYQDQPFLNTNCYVYDETTNCLFIHRAKAGRTSFNLEHNARVCYTVVEMGRLIPASQACNFGIEFRSVVIFGRVELVSGAEAGKALQMLMEKYAPGFQPGLDYPPIDIEKPQSAAVYRITIEQWSGKKKEVAADHPA